MGTHAVGNDQTAWCSNGTQKKENPERSIWTPEKEKNCCIRSPTFALVTVIRDKRGVVGDVARAIGGSMVAPPVDPVHIQRYFGDLKGFGAVDELVRIVTGGVLVDAAATGADLERAVLYGNHPSVNEHLPAV